MVIAIAGIAVMLVAVMVATSGDDPKPKPKPAAKSSPQVAKPEPKPAAPKKAGTTLKEPDRPAPALDAAALKRAEALYQQANQLNNEARKLQSAGNTSAFNKTIRKAWEAAEGVYPILRGPMDWQDEALLEDWKVPASYRPLERLLGKVNKLRGRIKRVLPSELK